MSVVTSIGKAERVVQLEGVQRRDRGVGGVGFPRALDDVLEQLRALLEGAAEALLLRARPAHDRVALALELGVGGAHDRDDLLDEARQEAGLDADPAALLDRAAHDPAQDVAAVLVGRHDAVGDEEGQRARVVGEDAQRALVGLGARQLAPERHERRERVGLEDRVDALLDDRHPLQAEARVDVARRQRREALAAVGVRRQVVLREDEVPVLQEALVLAAGQVVGGAPVQAAIDVQLAARPARPARARPARSSPSAGTGRSARAARRPTATPRSPPRPGRGRASRRPRRP